MTAYLTTVVIALLRVIQALLFVRAILSWFPTRKIESVMELLYAATEPVLIPFRMLLRKIPGVSRVPFDFSLLIVYFLIELLIGLL